ncbi:hypothetical protein PR002_g26002 [Phytophthora rubi]|uniref:Uncharacterized protein n=1 Tax=Phytophthora rubi TaxID=129364 RepID=A0A6A3HTS3_9STRA|nr:hypothetical protein PR002_g26002 [Phytophthora rubi]
MAWSESFFSPFFSRVFCPDLGHTTYGSVLWLEGAIQIGCGATAAVEEARTAVRVPAANDVRSLHVRLAATVQYQQVVQVGGHRGPVAGQCQIKNFELLCCMLIDYQLQPALQLRAAQDDKLHVRLPNQWAHVLCCSPTQ